MRRLRHVAGWAVAVVGGCVLLFSVQAARGDEASAKARLAEKGIRASRSGISLQAETEFSKSVSTAYSLRRKLSAAAGRQQEPGSDDGEADSQITALRQQNEQLQKRIMEIRLANIDFLGQTTRQLNEQIAANNREIARIQESRKQSTKSGAEAGKDKKSSRDAYTQQISDARMLADHLIDQYAELSKDQEVVAAIKEWNEAAHTHVALKPSHSFESSLRRLEALEKKLTSEKIPVRHEGNSYYAAVMINGEKKYDMAVDTAAPMLLLPHQAAIDAGVKLGPAAQSVTVQTADGAKTQAQRATLKSVRIGSFSANNVSCGVLPETDKSGKAVLGKSFLSKFKADLNTGASELSLARLGTEAAHTTKRTPRHRAKTTDPADTSQE
jgi:clan AA aspartic protease (TIGR02281 family)